MRKSLLFGLFAIALLGISLLPASAQGRARWGQHEVEADGLLIKMKPGTAQSTMASVPETVGGQVIRNFSRIGWQHVRIPKGMTLSEAASRFKQLAEVATVEPNYIYHTTTTPNDSRYSSQWGLPNIQAPTAWDTTTGNGNVVVAVIDSGVEYSHPDLNANMWRNPGEVAGNGVDDDSNGYVDDVYGINAITRTGNPMDDSGHGTHVAGIIGGVGNNGTGVAGVNWNVKMMALKFIGSNGSGSTADAVTSYEYLIAMKQRGVNVRVVSNSWGGGGFSSALNEAMNTAGGLGIISMCAAGNGGSDGVGDNNDTTAFYPANNNSQYIVSVASSDSSNNRSSFSNYGATTVDLAAPGSSIMSTYRNASYASMSGTSMATPFVSGAAALVLVHNPTLSALDLKNNLMNSVDKLSQWTGRVVSGGRLNVARAIANAGGGVITPPPPPPPPAATYQPDLLIRTVTSSAYVGDNVYSTGSDQSVAQTVASGVKATYIIQVQNGSTDTDAVTLTGPMGSNGWTVRYYNAASGGSDITSQMTGTGWRIASLTAGAAATFRVEVTTGSTVAGGASFTVAVKAASQADLTKTDMVRAVTTKASTYSPKLTSLKVTASPVSPRPVNTPITLMASATGNTMAEFLFQVGYYTGYGWSWTQLRGYSTSPTVTWTPTKAGSYAIRVTARPVGSTSSSLRTTISYTVTAR